MTVIYQRSFCSTLFSTTATTPMNRYSEFGMFEDRATMAVIHRASSEPPTFTVANDTVWCNITIASSNLHLSYRKTGAAAAAVEPFTAHSLVITDGTYTFHAGDTPTGNLGGTVSTLSGVDGAIPLNCTGASAPGKYFFPPPPLALFQRYVLH